MIYRKVSPLTLNSKGLSPNAKLFADETSLISVIHNNNTSRIELNDFSAIKNLPFQWKMSFNPDPSKKLKK